MTSQAQIDANRRNAQKSTGPATPEGRAAVRLNALKHGLTSTTLLLNDEDRYEFERLCDAYEAEYQPVGPTEEALLKNLVAAEWRMGRARRFEVGFFARQCFELSNSELNYATFNTHTRLSDIVDNDSKSADTLVKISRYETNLQRAFYKALNELRRTQRHRPTANSNFANQTQLPHEPGPGPQLVPKPDEPSPSTSATLDCSPSCPTSPTETAPPPPSPSPSSSCSASASIGNSSSPINTSGSTIRTCATSRSRAWNFKRAKSTPRISRSGIPHSGWASRSSVRRSLGR